jgi:RNA polymerase sigma-70 factor (ECF subfamily)
VEQGPLQSLQIPVKDTSAVSNDPSDERLATRIAAHDVSAFGLVYDRYSQPVFAMAGHMLGVHEAEEAAQEIFMRLWHKASQYDPTRGPFSHWFMSIARNHILDKLRARSERMRIVAAEEIDLLLSEAADPRVDVLEQVWQNQRGDALLQALLRIPPEQRRVIVLAYFGGMSQSEIAHYLGIPLGTVKKRIRLGLQKLRGALSPHALLDLDWDDDETLPDNGARVNMRLSNE